MTPADEHRDPDIDAAWRAASREQPPPALDAAITAAARRAVGAGPKNLHAPRAWWPVAAAAVVAVVAIGIVEMTPPDEVAPTAIAPAPPQPAAQPGAMRDERAPALAVPERPPSKLDQATRQAEPASPPVRADAPGAATEAKRKAAKPGNPFPGSPSEPGPAANAAPTPVDRLTSTPAAPQTRQEAAPSTGGAAATQAPASPAQGATAPAGAAGALAARRESASSNASPPALAKRAQEGVAAPDETEPRTVDEWVRLIRRLKAEGRNDLAAKELAAFRARYQQRADALLPPDLREARP